MILRQMGSFLCLLWCTGVGDAVSWYAGLEAVTSMTIDWWAKAFGYQGDQNTILVLDKGTGKQWIWVNCCIWGRLGLHIQKR